MNLLSIIVILLALATAGAIFYAAWRLSSDKPFNRRIDESLRRNSQRSGSNGETEKRDDY